MKFWLINKILVYERVQSQFLPFSSESAFSIYETSSALFPAIKLQKIINKIIEEFEENLSPS